MNADTEIIPMRSRAVHKFYEPLVLFKALTMELKSSAKYNNVDEHINLENPREVFEAFLNKLGHVCEKIKGRMTGDITSCGTMTSFLVLQMNEAEIAYWFACNQQTEDQLQDTAWFVKNLLDFVNKSPEQPLESHFRYRKRLLRYVLVHNRQRVGQYLQSLQSATAACLQKCCEDRENHDDSTLEKLEQLGFLLDSNWNDQASSDDYIKNCMAVIRQLRHMDKSPVGAKITQLARETRQLGQRSDDCWAEMRHMMNRILAYRQSVVFFFLARSMWPQLFQNFEVNFVPSSQPSMKPGRNKSYTAESIVNRMTSKEKYMTIFKRFVNDLQLFDLDDRIRRVYHSDTFRPIVHGEVLLHNWLDETGGARLERFFNGWMYIGSSKPLCKLCLYYFEESHSDVGHRASHEGLYVSWRLPDVPKSRGEEGENKRQKMYDRLLTRIRKDAFDLVRKKKEATYRTHDSNTWSARLTREDPWTLASNESDADDVASLMGNLGIEDILKENR